MSDDREKGDEGMSETLRSVRFNFTVDNPEAVYLNKITKKTHRVKVVEWACYPEPLGIELTAWGEPGEGCETWWGEAEIPEWAPEPPAMFYTFAKQVAQEASNAE